MASATGTTRTGEGEVASFYGAVWSEARARRREIAIAVEVVMVVAWFLVRTVADVDSRVYLLWLLAAGALALVAPKSGLVVLIATSVFFEPDSLARTLAPRELIVLPLALGVLIQIAVDRFRWRPGLCDLARAPARRRDGAGRRAHVPGLRPGLPMACRPIVDRQHAGADHHPRRCRVDGAGRGPARARRRGRGGGRGVGRVPHRIRRAGVDLERAVRVGRVLEGVRGAAGGDDPVAERPVDAAHRADDGAAGRRRAGARCATARDRAGRPRAGARWRSTSRSAGRRSSRCTSSS